jgi:hypothetical protein
LPSPQGEAFYPKTQGQGNLLGLASGNDRGNELVDDFLNLILEQELLLFEPGELQQIARGTLLERSDHVIEIAVLLSEFSKARPKLGFSFSVQGFVSVTLNGEFRVLLRSLQAPDLNLPSIKLERAEHSTGVLKYARIRRVETIGKVEA